MEYFVSLLRPGMSPDQKAIALGKGSQGATAVCLTLGSLDNYYFELLDKLNITGTSIYMLFADVCERDIDKTGLMLVACDTGIEGLTRDKLLHAINNRGAGVDVEAIVTKMMKIANTNEATRSLFRNR